MTSLDSLLAPTREEIHRAPPISDAVDWLIDNAQTYARLLQSLRTARTSVHIAQLAFDADCAAFAGGSLSGSPADDTVLAELLIELARSRGVEVRVVLNESWLLNTARPLRKFLAGRGVAEREIEVRGMRRFPHFMHAKLVLIDGREAFLLGSPFVNSYWDDGAHIPFDARRPRRELGGRPLHDVSVQVRGAAVRGLEAMFAHLWGACGDEQSACATTHDDAVVANAPSLPSGVRVVCDAPDGMLPGLPDGATLMLSELLAGIGRARALIYVEHQYLTSRPIVAALADALRRAPALEIVLVLNQNPDLTAYRAWQNAQLAEHALLGHPRVGVFTLWSTDAHPARTGWRRINQLFIHSKVMIVDDEWAAVGTSNLDGVSMGDYGADFAGGIGRRVFRGVRNAEVNLILEAADANVAEAGTILELRERLWSEHLGVARRALAPRANEGWVAAWKAAAARNVRALSTPDATMTGRVLPHSPRAYPREQLRDIGVGIEAGRLELCYNPTWFGVHLSPHWIRNIF